MRPRKQKIYETRYVQAQALWDEQVNDTKLVPDLNYLSQQGFKIIKIIPREKDFFDIFFEREIFKHDSQKGIESIGAKSEGGGDDRL